MAAVSAEAFIDEILVAGLGIAHIVIGHDFVFGQDRRGDAGMLRAGAARAGFGVTSVAAVAAPDGSPYSSSRIRAHLVAGEPEQAAALLGRWWEIEARVERGDRRGRDLGFPTANLRMHSLLHPKIGIYAVWAGIDRGADTVWHQGAASFGVRPTFGGEELLFETHLFDMNADLYGRRLRVALCHYLRPELKFDDVAALTARMAEDCAAARVVLAAQSAPGNETGAVDQAVERAEP